MLTDCHWLTGCPSHHFDWSNARQETNRQTNKNQNLLSHIQYESLYTVDSGNVHLLTSTAATLEPPCITDRCAILPYPLPLSLQQQQATRHQGNQTNGNRHSPLFRGPCNRTFSPKDITPSGRTQRFLVTLYTLSFIICKLRLTTFITANDDDDDSAYSVKTQAPGGEMSWGRNVQGANWRRGETSINRTNRVMALMT